MSSSSVDGGAGTVVVVGVDESELSKNAFERAVQLFHDSDTKTVFHVVNVRPEIREAVDELYAFKSHHEKHKKEQDTNALLGSFKLLAEALGIQHQLVTLEGDPRTQLCGYCEKVHADILVTGSRGSGKIEWLKLGSVSAYCTHHAPCAVLVHRMRHHTVAPHT